VRTVVLDGLLNPAVACVRSLATAGYEVIVGSEARWSKAGLSRFCRRTFTYPDPKKQSREFVQCIIATLAREGPALLLPCSEPSALAISAEREAIVAAGGISILPTHAAMLFACDKQQTTRRASQLGIPVPRSWLVRTPNEAAGLARFIRAAGP
jgi:predicted ATP-grasp superfamily ATP-dependent carboligase